MSPVQAVTPLVHGAGRTVLPATSEATARQQVTNARRALTRAQNKLVETPSGYGLTRTYSPQWLEAEARVERAQQRLSAAENRLDAIRSQQPQRHPGAWSA